jgi:hypothetical protein
MGSNRHFAWQQSSGPNVRFGSKADIGRSIAMSALPPKADIVQRSGNVRFVPKADIEARGQNVALGPTQFCNFGTKLI